MNLVVQAVRKLKIGLNKLSVRRDSNLLKLAIEEDMTIVAFFACPTGRMGDEIVKVFIAPTDELVEYQGDVEYVNTFYVPRQGYHHAFILRDVPLDPLKDAN